jgi:chromosomal replication initiation ATPase DnaA
MTARAQLPLPFPHTPDYSAAAFLPATSNAQARTWLARTQDWPDHRLALWGEPGVGKTHLLRIWAEREGGVAVDDADRAGDEVALFHALNLYRDRSVPVLLVGRAPPSRWMVTLPDLRSRLSAITAVRVEAPDDDLLASLLDRFLTDRQMLMPSTLRLWLLRRLPRSADALRDAVARLDAAALAQRRAVTRGLAVAILGLGEDERN